MFVNRKTQRCLVVSSPNRSMDSPRSQLKPQQFSTCQQNNSKIHLEKQKTQNTQCNIEGEEQSWRTDVTRLQDLLHTYSNHSRWFLAKERLIDPQNDIASSETDPHKYSQLFSAQGAKTRWWRKYSLFNQRC